MYLFARVAKSSTELIRFCGCIKESKENTNKKVKVLRVQRNKERKLKKW